MKKYLVFFFICIFSFILSGCDLGNTPTSKVEDLLTKYQRLDKDIDNNINEVLDTENLTEKQKERYKKLLENQYKNMSYEIKDEKIDGDMATVTVEVIVLDYKKAIQDVENKYHDLNDYSVEEYNDSKLDRLEKMKEKVIYTLELIINKDKNGNWKMNALSNIEKKKLQGMY